MSQKTGMASGRILLNPLFLISVMAIGCYTGLQFPDYSNLLRDIGDMYIAILQMCVTPFMICVVASSVGKLIRGRETGINLGKFMAIICLGLLVVSFISVLAGVIGNPGASLSLEAQNALGSLVYSSEHNANLIVDYENPIIKDTEHANIIAFFTDLIPNNILASMSEGDSLKVFLFALAIGIILGFIASEQAESSFAFFKAIVVVISRLINWCMYLFPVGLFCLAAGQMSAVSPDVLGSMAGFIIVLYVAGLVFLFICSLTILFKTRMPYWRILSGLSNTSLIAFGSRNSFISIPSAIDELQRNFNVSLLASSLLAPIGFMFFRFGTVMMFCVTAIFMGQLYAIDLNSMTLTVALLSSLLAGIATAGAPNIAALSMLSFVLDTLGLPFDVAFILLLTINPIIDSIVTLVNVSGSCTAIILLSTTSMNKYDSENTDDDIYDIYVDNTVAREV